MTKTNSCRVALALIAVWLLSGAQKPVIADTAELVMPLQSGQSAPQFTALYADGNVYAFDPNARDATTVLIFYRGGWCPFCNMHLSELKDVVPQLDAQGVEVLFISADRPEILRSSLAEENQALEYTLLSDASMQIASEFGIAFRVPDSYLNRLKEFGTDLEQASGHSHKALPVPAVFVIDADGVVQFTYANPDYKIRLPSDKVVAAATQSAR